MTRSRKLSVLILLLFAILFIPLKSIQSSGSVFKDNFNGATLNTTFWQHFVVGSGVNLTKETDKINIAFDAAPQENTSLHVFGSGLSSICKLTGDFDVQVDYALATWPPANGVRVGLIGGGELYSAIAAVERVSFGHGDISTAGRELYLTDTVQAGIVAGADVTDTSGTLRLVREGATGKAYYLQAGIWQPLGVFPSTTIDTPITIASWSHDYLFIHQPIAISFDNFIVNSGQFSNCSFPTEIPTPTPTPTPAVIVFKQNDPRWKDKQYAYENGRCSTIEKCGCALSSIAMVLNSHGATKDPNGNQTTPETVNNYFKLNPKPFLCRDAAGNLYNGFVSRGYMCGQVNWGTPDLYSADAYKNFGTQKILWLTKNTDQVWNPDTVKQDVTDNKPVILKVLSSPHWAVATGLADNSFSINDPSFNRTRLDQSPYTNSALTIRRYIKTFSDFSRFEAATFAPNQLLVTDPDGKKTGYDPSSSSIKEDIPDSSYFFDKMIDDDTSDDAPPPDNFGVNWLVISTPKKGNYSVKITSPQGEESNFVVYSSDRNASLTFQPFESSPSATTREYAFSYSPEPGTTQLSQNVTIDIRPLVSQNIVLCRNKLEIIPVALFSSNTFNTEDVDLDSVRFEGAPIMTLGGKFKFVIDKLDVNHDGKKDLIMSFKLSDTKLTCQSTNGALTGKTKSGLEFKGSDNVKMVK